MNEWIREEWLFTSTRYFRPAAPRKHLKINHNISGRLPPFFKTRRDRHIAHQYFVCLSSIRGLATPWTYFLHLPLSCHSDWFFHGEFWPRLDIVHPGCAWSFPTVCTWHCSLHYISPGNSLVSSWCDHSMLASLFRQCPTVSCLGYSSFVKNPLICFLCCPRNPRNLSQSFHLEGIKTCFFILSESPAFTAYTCAKLC